eukprot:scaffold160870_cov73-Attheya_sp.AAC.4
MSQLDHILLLDEYKIDHPYDVSCDSSLFLSVCGGGAPPLSHYWLMRSPWQIGYHWIESQQSARVHPPLLGLETKRVMMTNNILKSSMDVATSGAVMEVLTFVSNERPHAP